MNSPLTALALLLATVTSPENVYRKLDQGRPTGVTDRVLYAPGPAWR